MGNLFEIVALFVAMVTLSIFALTLWAVSRSSRKRAEPKVPVAELVLDSSRPRSEWNDNTWRTHVQLGARRRFEALARWAPLILLSIALTGIVMMGLMFLCGIVLVVLF